MRRLAVLMIGIFSLGGCAAAMPPKAPAQAAPMRRASVARPAPTSTPPEFWLAAPVPSPTDPAEAWRLPSAPLKEDATAWKTAAAQASPAATPN